MSAKSGGGRSRSPSVRLLSHLSMGSASSTTLPAAPHPRVELDQHFGRLRARMRHQQQRMPLEARRIRGRDRRDREALLDPRHRRVPAAHRARTARRTATAGWSAAPAAAARWGAASRWLTSAIEPPRWQRPAPARSSSVRVTAPARARLPRSVVDCPGATPICASGSSGSTPLARPLAAGSTAGSSPDRLTAVPSRTSRNTKASPVSPMRTRWIRSLLFRSCMRRT